MQRIFWTAIVHGNKGSKTIEAMVDTGSVETLIDSSLVKLIGAEDLGYSKPLRGASGGIFWGRVVRICIDIPKIGQSGCIDAVSLTNTLNKYGTDLLIGTDYAYERDRKMTVHIS